jgi:hypothetical protein
MSETINPAGTRRGHSSAARPIEASAQPAMGRGCVGVVAVGVEIPAMDIAYEQLQRELDGARLAVVSLLAVLTDEQFRGVEKALMSVAPMSETAGAALQELRTPGGRQRLAGEEAASAPKNSTAV